MYVKKINNVSFGGIYRIPYTKQNLFELKNFVLPEELAVKRAEDLSCDEWLKIFSPALKAHAEEI